MNIFRDLRHYSAYHRYDMEESLKLLIRSQSVYKGMENMLVNENKQKYLHNHSSGETSLPLTTL